ncbi:putative ankyrin repeat-containing domain, PGG domain, ankyrin repeat-containing domain superfamily [Helianthus annuus]|uniref:Ankyrin repeat-containing domain, PGG domain, ankyrin repeat-containing domain superfamily n=2 Tax=Helianthus annuus TaxID=4232 RepID=A0A9K3IDM5_HELAN|nr:putative ankyrin repeat-containing domain, PGG domain, ankyrin repeat-containing domain superfamily [Helianthus annuus]KAJ0538346.1 putative ankyrin repeat-containing domain, PGG domain, ankyrin repeat-containing domain superfamily [Helianthus annuus]KAJ0546222.1 putative ankyrin repeat-containing domain, PGG domain, ankyrin repeat-containing domain superfamily [Helianthus annuus]KAJ0552977.1 putative ankyrin repeat-containing domain, PGG domain, ankyrin repeat-containing domain superfamily [
MHCQHRRDREDYLNLVAPLYEASIVGDWETAKIILDKRPDLVRFGLKKDLGTALHVAATAEETKHTVNYVKNLVNTMTMEELELKNKYSNTAFWVASLSGKTEMAMIMMEKNRDLLNIRGNHGILPLSICAIMGSYNLVKYLYKHSQQMNDNHWTDSDRSFTLLHCVERNFFVQSAAKDETDALKILKIIWGHATRTMDIDEIEDMLTRPPTFSANGTILDSSGILRVAAEMGNTRFIVELLRTYPDLMLYELEDGLTIFHIAVTHRHQGIYNLLYEIGGTRNDICTYKDKSGNNMLHLVGKSSKEMETKKSGASLLMQRELLWFKEVEKMMPPYLREAKNKDGQTPYELFSIENQDLVSKGLQWMKDCMVATTLIVTVAFAVAFTVPGGYNQEHGLPVLVHQPAFLVFIIADAISLFSSSTSLLVFLSILTSRHDQLDFMYSLPRKLMIGLLTLFISVAAMMLTFSACFSVLYKELKWVPILVAAFATIPVIVFAVLQFPLLVDMFRSMYDSHYIFEPKKCMLYTTKPRLHSNNSTCWWFPYQSTNKRIFFEKC